MSHVVTIDLKIYDLAALEVAAAENGCELVKKSTFVWYGRHVGDYPLPEGFQAEDMGKCEWAIRSKTNDNAYEVGVVKARDGSDSYTLMYDFYGEGRGMSNIVGDRCQRLQQAYATEVARKKLRKQGFSVRKKRNEQGQVVLVGTKM